MNSWNVLQSAWSGDVLSVRGRVALLQSQPPNLRNHRHLAMAVRAMLAIGESPQQIPFWGQLASSPDPHAHALMRLLSANARQRCRLDVIGQGAGLAADAGCDWAWLLVQSGALRRAAVAIEAALHRCPLHIEARLWKTTLWSQSTSDRELLFPQRHRGWFSSIRMNTRFEGHLGPWPHTAAGQLLEVGVVTPALKWTASMPESTAIWLESESDLAVAWHLHRLGRCPEDVMRTLWNRARAYPKGMRNQIAAALVHLGLATKAPSRSAVAAAEILALNGPDTAFGRCALAILHRRCNPHQHRPSPHSMHVSLQNTRNPREQAAT